MLVEFVGCDGSGKTTLMYGVQAELQSRGIAAECVTSYLGFDEARGELTGTQKGVDFLCCAVGQPRLVLYYLLRVPREPFLPGRAWSQHFRRMYWLLRGARCSAELRRRSGLYLFDEGPTRTVARIIGRNGERCHGLLKVMPVPDVIVGVTVEPDVAVRRVRDRRPNEISREVIIDRAVTDTAGLQAMPLAAPTFLADTTQGQDFSIAITDMIERYRDSS